MDKTTHEARLNYLRQFYAENRPPYTGQNIIPESVQRDYEPSGKIAYQTIPLMLLAGLAGAGAGYIAHLLLSELGFGIFTATFDSGGCFSIIILFAGILVIFSPLAIPILSAIFVNLAAPRSKCRSFRLATILGILGGLICSVVVIYISDNLICAFMNLIADLQAGLAKEIDSIAVFLITLILEGLFENFEIVYFVILGILCTLLFVIITSGAADHPFCETKNTPMKERVVQRILINDLHPLLLFLIERNPDLLNEIHVIQKHEKNSWDEIPRLELTVWTAEENISNLLEVTVYFIETEKSAKKKRWMESSLVYSKSLSKQEFEFFSSALDFKL